MGLLKINWKQLMRIVSEPAKRANGWPKELFDRPLAPEDVAMDTDGVTLNIIVKDIYSKGSNQRYAIELSEDDLAAIIDAMPDDMRILAAE
jgi:hypothetical protein